MNTTFYEKINVVKLDHIVNNYNLYKNQIETEEKDMRRTKGYNAHKALIKMLDQVFIPEEYIGTEYGLLKISYSTGKNSNGIGRLYANNGIGIQPLCCSVRHTICENIWLDIDQVNSHPTILKQLFDKYDLVSPKLNKYLNNREKFLSKVMEEEQCSRDKAKTKVIAIINGSSKYTGLKLKALDKELKPLIASIAIKKEYKTIYDDVTSQYKINISGKTISRILQVIENNVLQTNIEFCNNKGLLPKYRDGYIVSLIFDGFQLPLNEQINQELLNECSLYTYNKTQYKLDLKIKPFDNLLELPEDYAINFDISNYISKRMDLSLKTYSDLKKEVELTKAKIIYPPMIASFTNKGYELQSIKKFEQSFDHLAYRSIINDKEGKIMRDKRGEIKYKSCIFHVSWLLDPTIRVYERNVFKPPPLVVASNEHNCWIDLKIKDEPLIITDRDYYKEWLDFGYNLIGNKEAADVIIARYAQRIQTPAKRSNICVVYYGEERIGKNRFINPIKKIFGNYYQDLDSAKKLYDNHSMYEYQKLFICVNEAQGIDNFSNADILKTRITENTLSINPKGIQSFEIDNMCDYDMTTNNFNVIKITDESYQRFFQVECSNHYKGNHVFFNDYIENIEENPIAIRQIYEGLMKFDVKSIIPSGNFQIDKPITSVEIEVKEQNKDKVLLFYEDLVKDYIQKDDGTKFDSFKYTNQELFNIWLEWLKESHIEMKMDKHKFGIKTAQLIKTKFKDSIIKDSKNSTTKINFKQLADRLKNV